MQRITFKLNGQSVSGVCRYLNQGDGFTTYQFLSPVDSLQYGIIIRSDRDDMIRTTSDTDFQLNDLSFC